MKLKSRWLMTGDFSGSPVVKNPPSNAGDTDLIPDRETKIPQASEQLSLHSATRETRVLQQRLGTAKIKGKQNKILY